MWDDLNFSGRILGALGVPPERDLSVSVWSVSMVVWKNMGGPIDQVQV